MKITINKLPETIEYAIYKNKYDGEFYTLINLDIIPKFNGTLIKKSGEYFGVKFNNIYDLIRAAKFLATNVPGLICGIKIGDNEYYHHSIKELYNQLKRGDIN